jgi:hypothetical protein
MCECCRNWGVQALYQVHVCLHVLSLVPRGASLLMCKES